MPEATSTPSAHALVEAGHARVREKKWDEAVAAYRKAVAIEPNLGIAYGSLGYCYEQLKQPDEAVEAYKSGSALMPDNAEIVFNLGNVYRSQGKLDGAITAYKRTLAIDRAHVRALNNLGTIYQILGNAAEAIAVYQRALGIKPDYAEAKNNLGSAHIALNEIPEALKAYKESLIIDPTIERTRFNEGVARLLAGDLPQGWTGYEHRASPPSRAGTKGEPWNGKVPLAGKTILLTCEQGLGDTIQFVRYAELIENQGAKVHLEVQPPLKRLLSNVRYASSVVAVGEVLPNHDLHCSLLSLPFALQTTLTSIPQAIPYIRLPAAQLGEGKKRAASQGIRIGFVWAGNPAHKNDRWRSIPLSLLLPVLTTVPSTLVSLQKEVTPADSATLALYPEIKDLSESLNDFTDTAAIISELDLVISVDSAVAHLAGAMGKPVWILLAFSPDWRWMLGRLNSPWYPTARLFRQTQFGDWNSVLSKLGETLKEKISDISR